MPCFLQLVLVILARIGRALVRVVQKPSVGTATAQRHVERLDAQVPVIVLQTRRRPTSGFVRLTIRRSCTRIRTTSGSTTKKIERPSNWTPRKRAREPPVARLERRSPRRAKRGLRRPKTRGRLHLAAGAHRGGLSRGDRATVFVTRESGRIGLDPDVPRTAWVGARGMMAAWLGRRIASGGWRRRGRASMPGSAGRGCS